MIVTRHREDAHDLSPHSLAYVEANVMLLHLLLKQVPRAAAAAAAEEGSNVASIAGTAAAVDMDADDSSSSISNIISDRSMSDCSMCGWLMPERERQRERCPVDGRHGVAAWFAKAR